MIKAEGYTAAQAADGAEAIEVARSARPDVVILDLMMPEVSGFEVARALRDSEQTARIPILALTALAMKGDRERLINEGFDGYLEEPIRYKEFLASVAALLTGRSE